MSGLQNLKKIIIEFNEENFELQIIPKTYNELYSEILKVLENQLKGVQQINIKYKDTDEDLITLESDDDLQLGYDQLDENSQIFKLLVFQSVQQENFENSEFQQNENIINQLSKIYNDNNNNNQQQVEAQNTVHQQNNQNFNNIDQQKQAEQNKAQQIDMIAKGLAIQQNDFIEIKEFYQNQEQKQYDVIFHMFRKNEIIENNQLVHVRAYSDEAIIQKQIEVQQQSLQQIQQQQQKFQEHQQFIEQQKNDNIQQQQQSQAQFDKKEQDAFFGVNSFNQANQNINYNSNKNQIEIEEENKVMQNDHDENNYQNQQEKKQMLKEKIYQQQEIIYEKQKQQQQSEFTQTNQQIFENVIPQSAFVQEQQLQQFKQSIIDVQQIQNELKEGLNNNINTISQKIEEQNSEFLKNVITSILPSYYKDFSQKFCQKLKQAFQQSQLDYAQLHVQCSRCIEFQEVKMNCRKCQGKGFTNLKAKQINLFEQLVEKKFETIFSNLENIIDQEQIFDENENQLIFKQAQDQNQKINKQNKQEIMQIEQEDNEIEQNLKNNLKNQQVYDNKNEEIKINDKYNNQKNIALLQQQFYDIQVINDPQYSFEIPASQKQQVALVVKNIGQQQWPKSLVFQCMKGLNEKDQIQISSAVKPNEQYQISFWLLAPSKVGKYESQWRFQYQNEEQLSHQIGPEIKFEINVVAGQKVVMQQQNNGIFSQPKNDQKMINQSADQLNQIFGIDIQQALAFIQKNKLEKCETEEIIDRYMQSLSKDSSNQSQNLNKNQQQEENIEQFSFFNNNNIQN